MFHELVTDEHGDVAGYFTVRAAIQVAADGQTLTATYTLEFPAGSRRAHAGGNSRGSIASGPGHGTAVIIRLPGPQRGGPYRGRGRRPPRRR